MECEHEKGCNNCEYRGLIISEEPCRKCYLEYDGQRPIKPNFKCKICKPKCENEKGCKNCNNNAFAAKPNMQRCIGCVSPEYKNFECANMNEPHKLKTINPYFNDVDIGTKTFEVRKNDRNFKVGDIMILEEFIPPEKYTGRKIPCIITYVLDHLVYCAEGYVILGFKKL